MGFHLFPKIGLVARATEEIEETTQQAGHTTPVLREWWDMGTRPGFSHQLMMGL